MRARHGTHHLALPPMSQNPGLDVLQGPAVACLYRPYRRSLVAVSSNALLPPATDDATKSAAAWNCSSMV